MVTDLERRFLAVASDILRALAAGQVAPTSPVVRAAGAALDELRRGEGDAPEGGTSAAPPPPELGPGAARGSDRVAASSSGTTAPAPGVPLADLRETDARTPAERDASPAHGRVGLREVEGGVVVGHVVAVARHMRKSGVSFASACAARASSAGTSPQAVRNACTRALGIAARDWQPVAIPGAREQAHVIARRAVARYPSDAAQLEAAFGTAPSQPD